MAWGAERSDPGYILDLTSRDSIVSAGILMGIWHGVKFQVPVGGAVARPAAGTPSAVRETLRLRSGHAFASSDFSIVCAGAVGPLRVAVLPRWRLLKPSGAEVHGSLEMDMTWRTIIWPQFGAAIDMLDNALRACPDQLWRDRLWNNQSERPEYSQFWYIAYHALFWLDFYLSGSVEGFVPPAPFTLDELDPAGLLPERPYSKDELQIYLEHGRKKCRATIEALTDEKARQRCRFAWGEMSFAELLLYNMRHVQEHATQLNLMLGQKIGSAPGWVTKAKSGRTGE